MNIKLGQLQLMEKQEAFIPVSITIKKISNSSVGPSEPNIDVVPPSDPMLSMIGASQSGGQ